MLKPEEDAARQKLMAVPKVVRDTATWLFLYSVLSFLNLLIAAFQKQLWGPAWFGFVLAVLGLQLTFSLFQLKRWAYWVLVLVGGLHGLRCLFDMMYCLAEAAKHLHLPLPYWIIGHALGAVFLLPIVVRLLMRPSRVAFGFVKPAIASPPESSERVWPPPLSLPRENA